MEERNSRQLNKKLKIKNSNITNNFSSNSSHSRYDDVSFMTSTIAVTFYSMKNALIVLSGQVVLYKQPLNRIKDTFSKIFIFIFYRPV